MLLLIWGTVRWVAPRWDVRREVLRSSVLSVLFVVCFSSSSGQQAFVVFLYLRRTHYLLFLNLLSFASSSHTTVASLGRAGENGTLMSYLETSSHVKMRFSVRVFPVDVPD
jgi:hypothetical protein